MMKLWASLVAQLVKNPPAMWETWVRSLSWRRERLPTPVFWPGEFHGLCIVHGVELQRVGQDWATFTIQHGFDPWVGKIPWRREWLPIPVFLPGKSHGQRSLAGNPWGPKESDMTEQFHFHFTISRHCVEHWGYFILFFQQNCKAGFGLILQKRKVGLSKNLLNMWWNQDLNPSLALYIIIFIISFEFTCPNSGL